MGPIALVSTVLAGYFVALIIQSLAARPDFFYLQFKSEHKRIRFGKKQDELVRSQPAGARAFVSSHEFVFWYEFIDFHDF